MIAPSASSPFKEVTGLIGKLRFQWLEAPIADHCNLRCKSCSHHAPYLIPHLYDLGRFTKDVNALSRVSEFSALFLIGGEPLLNPLVDDYLAAGRDSGIAKVYGVITNGLLLHKMTKRFFELVDYIIVSIYPVTLPKRKNIEELLADRSRQFNFTYEMQETNFFYDIETDELSEDDAQRSFDRCTRRLSSPLIHSGFFYKCMRPPTTREYLIRRKICILPPDFGTADGVSLDSVDLSKVLREYMNKKVALQSCRFCLLGFLHDSYKSTAYTWLKSKLRKLQFLRNLSYSVPCISKLHHSLNARLVVRDANADNLVQIHKHEIMNRRCPGKS